MPDPNSISLPSIVIPACGNLSLKKHASSEFKLIQSSLYQCKGNFYHEEHEGHEGATGVAETGRKTKKTIG